MQSCLQLDAQGKTKQKTLWHNQNSAPKLYQTSGSGKASAGEQIFVQKGHNIDLTASGADLHPLTSVQIIASAHYMLSELFQLDEPSQEDVEESLRAGGSEDSYSDDDREEEDDDLSDGSDENGSHSKQDDRKAVAVIRSVGELSVPEKYKSTHQIRVSPFFCLSHFICIIE